MKNAILLVFCALLTTTSIFSQWNKTKGPEGGYVYHMDMIDGVIWAGTPGGVYKSFDKGESWVHTNIVDINRDIICINHSADEILMIGFGEVKKAIYILRSLDGGETWEKNDIDIIGTLNPAILGSASSPNSQIFRLDNAIFIYWNAFLMKSDDNGETWQLLVTALPSSQFAHDGEHFVISKSEGLFLSLDSGEHWDKIKNNPSIWNGNLFIEDSLIIYLGFNGKPSYDAMVSNDLGASFSDGVAVGTDGFGFSFRGEDGCLYLVNGNVHKSCDEGETWEKVTGFNCTTIRCAIQYSSTLLIGGNWGFAKVIGKKMKYHNTGYTGKYIKNLWTTPNGNLYANVGALIVSKDKGNTWKVVKNIYNETLVMGWGVRNFQTLGDTLLIGEGNRFSFYLNNDTVKTQQVPFLENIKVSDSRIFGFQQVTNLIYYSDDLGTTWTTVDLPENADGLVDYAIRGNEILYIAENGFDPRVFISSNLGLSWTDRGVFPLDYSLFELKDRVFLGWQVSDNFGKSWKYIDPKGIPISNNKPLKPNAMIQKGDSIYASIFNHGLFVSSDLGKNWAPFSDGLETTRGTCFAIQDDQLFLGTWCNGLWISNPNIVGSQTAIENESPLQVWPNPASKSIEIQLAKDISGDSNIEIYNSLGQRVLFDKATISQGRVEIDLPNLNNGTYLVRLVLDGFAYSGKLLVIR